MCIRDRYIAGNIFKSRIAHHFDNSLSGSMDILILKCFLYDLNQIKFSGESNEYLLFSAYSKTLKKMVQVRMDRNVRDWIEIE